MRLIFIFIALLAFETTHQNWFTDAISAPFKYLKKRLMPDRAKFKLDKLDKEQREMVSKFLEMKEDGLGISYSLIYYNLMLNLEKECLFVAEQLEDCELFVKHIQSIINKQIKNGSNGYEFPLIEDFYNSIFYVKEQLGPIKKYSATEDALLRLKDLFNQDQDFVQTREALTEAYNESLRATIKYLNSNIAPEIVEVVNQNDVQPQNNEYVDY